MTRSVLIFAEKAKGQIFMDSQELSEQLNRLADGPLEFRITQLRPTDTSVRKMQNYFHAVPVEVCRHHFGLQHDPMRYALMGEWRGYQDTPLGKQVPNCASERGLSREDWTELIAWVLEWGPSEHGLFIPAPDSAKAKELTDAFSRGAGKAMG